MLFTTAFNTLCALRNGLGIGKTKTELDASLGARESLSRGCALKVNLVDRIDVGVLRSLLGVHYALVYGMGLKEVAVFYFMMLCDRSVVRSDFQAM